MLFKTKRTKHLLKIAKKYQITRCYVAIFASHQNTSSTLRPTGPNQGVYTNELRVHTNELIKNNEK